MPTNTREDGFTVPYIANNSISSGESRKRKEEVYCQVLSTPASTRRVLAPFSSSKLPSSLRGRPALTKSVEATRLYYTEVARENDAAKSRLQEELIAAQEELVRVRERCRELENKNTRLETERRKLFEEKRNNAIIYQPNDPYQASQVFLKELSGNNENEDAEVVAGVVRALAKKKFKKHLLQAVDVVIKSNDVENRGG